LRLKTKQLLKDKFKQTRSSKDRENSKDHKVLYHKAKIRANNQTISTVNTGRASEKITFLNGYNQSCNLVTWRHLFEGYSMETTSQRSE